MKNQFNKWLFLAMLSPMIALAQENVQGTLDNVVNYALSHSPALKQSVIDQKLTDLNIKNTLSNWTPQVTASSNYQYNPILNGLNPVAKRYTSDLSLNASQNIINRDLWLAKRTAEDNKMLSKQNTELSQIELIVAVKKAFYATLLQKQQIELSQQDIERNRTSEEITGYQYKGGIVDKTDNRRAAINLNNAKAQKFSSEQAYNSNLAYLKQLMGYNSTEKLELIYELENLEKEAYTVLNDSLDVKNLKEYQTLETQKNLKKAEIEYNKKSWIPTVQAQAGYNWNFQDNKMNQLYDHIYDGAYVGVGASLPILQGGKRKNAKEITQLQIEQLDEQEHKLVNNMQASYTEAVNAYNAALYNYQAIKDNVALAQEVYDVVNLQYKAGVKMYLEVSSAETDYRNARTNSINALYNVLTAKIDVEKALGLIKP